MCDPVTLSAIGAAGSTAVAGLTSAGGLTALKIGSAVVGHMAEADAARRTNQRNAEARKAATEARDNEVRAQALKESQEKAVLQQKKTDKSIEAMRLSSRAALSAGEAGVGGAVVNAIMSQYERDRLTNNTNVVSDMEALTYQGTLDRKAIAARAQSRINQYQPVQGPNPLALMTKIGIEKAEGELREKY